MAKAARNQHYTRNTVSAAAWCAKCKSRTPHRIDDRRVGPCLVCIARLEGEAPAEPKREAVELWPMPCCCAKWPFPHHHPGGEIVCHYPGPREARR